VISARITLKTEVQQSRFAEIRSLSSSVGSDLDLSFLEPARAGDEIGWFEHYRLQRLLGAGGMGIVFLAEDSHLLRPVALKIVQPRIAADSTTRKRFLREARTMAAIHHEHVVVVYHVGMTKSRSDALELPYLAMQYTEGETLLDYLVDPEQLAFEEVARIGKEIAEGLEAAHTRGVIHRDIKPSNIWLTAPRRRVKIIDFGLARPLQSDIASSALSYSKQIIGTPHFMSPEQAVGDPVDPRTDLFSLGCVLYAALSGALPFDGTTPVAVLSKLMIDEPTPLSERRPDIPCQFSRFVHRLLAKLPADRPATATGAANELEEIEALCRTLGPAGSGSLPTDPERRRLSDAETQDYPRVGFDYEMN